MDVTVTPDDGVLSVHPEVAAARADRAPVVALESTIFSAFGLPEVEGRQCLDRCRRAIRAAGAVPALTIVLDGVAHVGLDESRDDRVFNANRKLGARDVPGAVAGRVESGATTVSASLMLAGRAGVPVFATGGIGGVHRGAERTGDVSADLGALARHPVTTVTAGAKAFLDLPRTVEHLETLGVPVVGLDTDEFPAFYSRSSGVPVSETVPDAAAMAALVSAGRALGYTGGFVLANPVPTEVEIPASHLNPVIDAALERADAAGLRGAEVTPFVLGAMVEATDGRTVPTNVALAVDNARVAAELAVALSELPELS